MKALKYVLPAAAALLLAACSSGGGGSNQTTGQVANDQIANGTSETAEPIVINDLPLSEQGTDETSSPAAVL